MSRNTKRIISFAGLLIITGFIIFAVGFSRLGWDWKELDDAEYTAHTLDINDPSFGGETQIDILNAKIDSFNIKIENGDEFKIDYYTSENSEVKINYTTRGDKKALEFSLTEQWHKTMFRMFNGLKKSQLEIVIVVPEGVELDLDVPSANLSVNNAKFGEVKIKGGSADVNFADVVCDSFTFSGGSADLNLARSTLGNVDINSSSGDIYISSGDTGDITFSGSSANLYLDTITAQKITADGSSSYYYLSAVTAVSVKVNGSSADISIRACQIDDFIDVFGSSSTTWIYSTIAKSFTGEGSSSDVYLGSGYSTSLNFSVFETIKFTGNSSKVQTQSAIECDKFDFKGSSSDFIITVYGTKEDFASISMSGSSTTFRLDGGKFDGSYTGSGTKTLLMSGNSSTCKLSFAEKN